VEDAGPRQLKGEVERLLELVVDAARTDAGVQRLSERCVQVVGMQEADIGVTRGENQPSGRISWGGRHKAHPRRSRKRQMTLATISSFLSSGFSSAGDGGLALRVRAAKCSSDVAPRQRAKSIVED
jgi:hypothetical protein